MSVCLSVSSYNIIMLMCVYVCLCVVGVCVYVCMCVGVCGVCGVS